VAHSLSARKRIRQNLRRRARNRARRSYLKTLTKQYRAELQRGSAEAAGAIFRRVCKVLDRLANQGTIHRNAAARRKSRLAKRLNALRQATTGAGN
jgi:small subunit ribosomal protein S20